MLLPPPFNDQPPLVIFWNVHVLDHEVLGAGPVDGRNVPALVAEQQAHEQREGADSVLVLAGGVRARQSR